LKGEEKKEKEIPAVESEDKDEGSEAKNVDEKSADV
jgi:hypothetical protein